MRYFRLTQDLKAVGAFSRRAETSGVDPALLLYGRWVADWPKAVTLYCDDAPVLDFLPNRLYWPVFSASVRSVVDSLGVDGLQFLPVTIVREDSDERFDHYYAVNVLNRLSAFDSTESDYSPTMERGEVRIIGVRRYTLRRAVIAGRDLFRLAEEADTIVVSERVKDALEREQVKGIHFWPVTLS